MFLCLAHYRFRFNVTYFLVFFQPNDLVIARLIGVVVNVLALCPNGTWVCVPALPLF